MIDVANVIKNENAIYDKGAITVRGGMSIQGLLKPEKIKLYILKPGTIRVTRYRVIAEEIHLNIPKVSKLIGRSSKLIIGLTKKEVKTIPSPASRILVIPFSKTIPDTAWLIK